MCEKSEDSPNYKDLNEMSFPSDDEDSDCYNQEDPNLLKLKDDQGNEYSILQCAEKGKIDLIERFVEIDPTLVNVVDTELYTPLHRACSNNQIEAVKYLVNNGANVEAVTVDGWKPIHSAAQWGNVELVRLLMAVGSDINSRTNGGNTPFHLAATRAASNKLLVEYLLFHDEVDIHAKNDAGDSPFDICKRNSRIYKLWDLL